MLPRTKRVYSGLNEGKIDRPDPLRVTLSSGIKKPSSNLSSGLFKLANLLSQESPPTPYLGTRTLNAAIPGSQTHNDVNQVAQIPSGPSSSAQTLSGPSSGAQTLSGPSLGTQTRTIIDSEDTHKDLNIIEREDDAWSDHKEGVSVTITLSGESSNNNLAVYIEASTQYLPAYQQHNDAMMISEPPQPEIQAMDVEKEKKHRSLYSPFEDYGLGS